VLPISEQVLDVIPTMNRGDLLSVYGLAREVAALLGGEVLPMPGTDPQITHPEWVDIEVEDTGGCPRYIGRIFRDVSVQPSPSWLQSRLAAAGMRSHSNVVDVTNYVMHAFGSPLHAFDLERLQEGKILVRRARPGEDLTTLDGTLRELEPRDLVIADAERAVAIAGVMGGLETEVGSDTTTVLLEAANFEPLTVLRTSERLGLRSEASNRWEKGVDPILAERAAVYASQLIVELAGARMTGSTDQSVPLPERPVVRLRPERSSRVIGMEVPPDEQDAILTSFGFEVSDEWDVTVPTWRARDVTREIDLVEEVARAVLDRVPHTLPLRRHVRGRLTKQQRLRRVVEDALTGAGCSEAYTWSLQPSDPSATAIRLPDPMTADQALLRTTLLPGLVEAARASIDAGAERTALFEIARVYLPSGEQLPDEHWRVGVIVSGGYPAAKGVLETLYGALHLDLRVERAAEPPAFLHPGRAAETEAGWVGELHPRLLDGTWGASELDLETLFERVPERVEYEDVITFPALRQDIAVAVGEEVEAGALVDAALEAGRPELREARVFDVYHGEQVGEGRKSVAIRLSFQSPDRTLSDEDAAGVRQRIVGALGERFGAELRG
jgi:phenylalanyl-tRNA synthetase beta chain